MAKVSLKKGFGVFILGWETGIESYPKRNFNIIHGYGRQF